MSADTYENALQMYRAGQLPDAQAMLRRVIAQQPGHFDALALLAMLAQRGGRLDEAVELLKRTVALRPDLAETHYNLGNALKAAGRLDEAMQCFQQAISLRPDFAEAHFNLANALRGAGRLKDAIESYRRTIAARPAHAGALNNLSSSLREAGFADQAMQAVRQAIAHKPDMAEAHNNLGNLLLDRGQTEQAIGSFARALQIRPQYVEALNNLGNAQRALGRLDEAEQAYRRAAAIQPDSAQTLWNLGTVQLALGNLLDGFANYEARLKLPNTSAMDFPQPLWQGENLQGKTILLHAEQGMGDAIQFLRYVPLVKERGARVIVICHDPLTRLFAGQLGIDQVIGFSEVPPTFDVHCPLMSLPHVFETTLANIPSGVPYLIADATLTQKWRQRLSKLLPKRNIGIVWAGNPAQTNDRFRSMSLSELAPLAQVKDARFINLQKGAASEQAKSPPPGMDLSDWSVELDDFVDTAALISALDGVVSVCTSPAHLAGALGKPVWLLLWKESDWRWLLDRSDSPWYPAMRLFRQSHVGQWAEPVDALARELAAGKSE
jgi:tetratricopeptide (TPR) repeat protein